MTIKIKDKSKTTDGLTLRMPMRALLFVICSLFFSISAMAQGVRISGTVTDNDGPVMMGNVVERDANNRIVSAAQTDFNGNFTLQIKNTNNKLVVSYVGDKTKVLSIGNQTVFKVKLDPENTQLKEVKVVGRRTNSGGLTIQKKEMTTATQTFNMWKVWRSPLPTRPFRVRLPVSTSCRTQVTSAPALRCACVV